MRNFLSGREAFAHQLFICGMKITTIGVLFINADMAATVGSNRKYPCLMLLLIAGKMRCIRGAIAPLRLTPSLTRNSSATVTIPRLAKPANASSADNMPVHRNSTTILKSISPGLRYSLYSINTIKAIEPKTIITSVLPIPRHYFQNSARVECIQKMPDKSVGH